MKDFIRILILSCLGFSAACGADFTGEFTGNPEFPASVPEVVEGKLLIFREEDATSREILAGVYPGDVVTLETRDEGERETVWSSTNSSLGTVSSSGVLQVHAPGEFLVRAQKGDRAAELRVRIGSERPYLGSDEDTPAPSSDPTPTPSASPAGETPPPTPTPPAEPSPPPSVDSDPYIDAVIRLTPGPFAGFGSDQFPQIVLGPPQGSGETQGGFHVLSLGVGGEIVLHSATPILNGPGVDFIVFENAFFAGGNPENPFAEVGEIAVSQDGTRFIAFPCEPENAADLYPGCAGVRPVHANPLTNGIDPTDPETAGGDAFDLETIGLNWAGWIRIRDLSESGGGVSAGFDLDAVAIIHQ